MHPISRFLIGLPRAAATDFAPLAGAVEAAARQISGAALERGAELPAHSRALRADPLMVAARLAAERTREAEAAVCECAAALAAAEYLAAAIGGYRREARAGRVAFPVDELLAAGIENADLAAAEPPLRLQSYLQELRRRAAQLFEAAAAGLPRAERAQLRHLLVLAALGARHLNARRAAADAGFRVQDLRLAWTTARRAGRQK